MFRFDWNAFDKSGKKSKYIQILRLVTVFENHRKSLIQHCEGSELRLHFEWTKIYQNMPKMVHFGKSLKTWSLLSNSVTIQVSFNRTKNGGKTPKFKSLNETFWVIFKQCGLVLMKNETFWDFFYYLSTVVFGLKIDHAGRRPERNVINLGLHTECKFLVQYLDNIVQHKHCRLLYKTVNYDCKQLWQHFPC